MIHEQETDIQSFELIFPDGREDNIKVGEPIQDSPNIVGLLAGLIAIPIMASFVIGVIWILWTLVTLFSPWNVMM